MTKKTEWDRDTTNMGFFGYWWYQYILASALYMLEPWERNLFHIVLLCLFAMMIYSAYIYMPTHSVQLYQLSEAVMSMLGFDSRTAT